LNRTPLHYASQICRIIDDFVDVVNAEADRSGRVLHGFQHQVPTLSKVPNID
jgi:hypothetical protein